MNATKPLALQRPLSLANGSTLTQTFWITTFALLTAIGAQIEIPHQPVPYTFQTLVVLLAGAVLGSSNGFLSMTMYLSLGVMGMPVFSAGGFGLARVLGPTGGYLLAFPLAAFVVGSLLSTRSSLLWILVSMIAGLAIIFSLGTVQLNIVYFHNWSSAFQAGFLIFSWWDVLKLIAATTIYHQFVQSRRT